MSYVPHVVSVKARVGEGKHANDCSIYSHLICQSLEPLWQRGCRELWAVHNNRWVLTAQMGKQKFPPRDPSHLLFCIATCIVRNIGLTQKWARTKSFIQPKRMRQFEQSDQSRHYWFLFQVGGIGPARWTSIISHLAIDEPLRVSHSCHLAPSVA